MGGPGSGRRWHYGASGTTEQYRSIDVRRWHKEDLLTAQDPFRWNWSVDGEVAASITAWPREGHVVLSYSYRDGSDSKDESYPVWLDWTPCNFGGTRPWFICPAAGCGRRAAILYLGTIFACRHCYGITYSSQRENRGDRADRRADRIREKLGWDVGLFGRYGKPKGMHWRTYERLEAEIDALEQRSHFEFDRRHRWNR